MRILVVENDGSFRDQLVGLLNDHGYHPFPISSLAGQTAEGVHQQRFDLALVDCRIRDDKDERDSSGLDFAKQLGKLGTPTVLVTAFPPNEAMLFDFLRSEELSGFIYKSLTMSELASCVEEFKVSHRFPNCMATFCWKGKNTAFATADWLEVGSHVKNVKAAPEDFAVLLRSLISPCASKVVLEPLRPGFGGAALFRAQISFGDGAVSEDVAIKYGHRNTISSEAMRYDRHVGPLPDGVAAHLRWRKETRTLGALAYSWVGTSLEDGVPFGPVSYRSPANDNVKGRNGVRGSSAELSWRRRQNALGSLFSVALDPWYEVHRSDSANQQNSVSLLAYYTDSSGMRDIPFASTPLPTKLPKNEMIKAEPDLQQWNFGKRGTLADPVYWLKTASISKARVKRYCPCHGDLHVKNIFVLPDDSARLIDFGETALGHVFRDFTAVEASIRLTCCNTIDPDILKIAVDSISSVGSLGEHIDYRSISESSADVREVLKTTMQIRRAALDAVGDYPPDISLQEYLFALTFRMLRYASGIADEASSSEDDDSKDARIWHALYAAAKTAQQAKDLAQGKLPEPELIDEQEENQKFNHHELRTIKSAIQEIRHFLVMEASPDAEYLKSIDERLNFLEEEAQKQNKKQWIYVAIGVVATIVDGLAMAPEQTHKLFDLLTGLFKNLFMKLLA